MIRNLAIKVRSLYEAMRRSVAHARRDELSYRAIIVKALRNISRGPRGFARLVVLYDREKRVQSMSQQILPEESPAVGLQGSSQYHAWLLSSEAQVPLLLEGPLITVVMPVCETPESFLQQVIASVKAQTYTNWELCICDDASTLPHVLAVLESVASEDPRVKVKYAPRRGGISAATNNALEAAQGDYIAFVDHDDLLHPDALAAVAAKFAVSSVDVVYTDHDCIDPSGNRRHPYFKPNWAPDLFHAQMYLGHLVVIKRSFLDRVGLFDSNMDGAQDYDLLLRCVENKAVIEHVPRVLYHWRQHEGSTSANADSKPYAHRAGLLALQRHFRVVGTNAEVVDGENAFCYDVRYKVDEKAVKASIIIPTRDGVDLLRACVHSLEQVTEYGNYELIIIDNGSVQPETAEYLQELSRDDRARVIRADIPFNWSLLNNLAARHASGDVLIFLNNDIEIIDAGWLGRLVENAMRPEIGVCGPLLLYGDQTIQHAGVVVGLGGWADHVFKGLSPIHAQINYVSPMLRRNVLAVTGACMAIEARKFQKLGGFNEAFIICGSDVELCLRAFQAGLYNLYLPESRLIHHESKTRDPRDIPEVDFIQSEKVYLKYRREGDPFYNPNLDTESCIPRLRQVH